MTDGLSDGALLALIGLGGGFLLGLAGRLGRFCTLGALEDALYAGQWVRLRMWAVALGALILGFAALNAGGWVDPQNSIYFAFAWNPAASIGGGLIFGYGMALAGNCGFGALTRLGGGDLRSLIIVMVMGVSAYMTIGGPLARLRVLLLPTEPSQTSSNAATDIAQVTGLSAPLIAALIALLFLALAFYSPTFRRSPKAIFWSLVIALGILSGWVGTSLIAERSFEPLRAGSHTFTAPLGESLIYLMTSSAGGLSFGIGSVTGVVIGACAGAMLRGHFRWEACDDPRELGRQILGAALMGVGGVTAFGCSVGQGLTAFAALSWSAPVTLAAITVGAAIGLRQLIQGFSSDTLGR